MTTNLTNEEVQAWIEEAKASDSKNAYRVRALGAALLKARRDLADIANGLQRAAKDLDSLKELL